MLENGLKFAPEGGKCTVTAELCGGPKSRAVAVLAKPGEPTALVRVAVTDDGSGFSEKELTELFQPYEQVPAGCRPVRLSS